MDEFTAWIQLARAPGLHAGVLQTLLPQLPSAREVVQSSRTQLIECGASVPLADWIDAHRTDDLSAELKWLDGERRSFIHWCDARYPALLRELPDAPIGLYVRGDAETLALHQLAIVGSRNPTPAGRENAARFAGELSRRGLAITSGLAAGVDAAAHRGALDGSGVTIAVCGAGLDIIYPRSNAKLADEIAERGALISEFPLGAPPAKANFPRRNRIISGLSLGVLVVEAAIQSGSLITARLAAEQGREVFAVPGSIHNALARGCHQLLRQGAKLVETADDILTELRAIAAAFAAPDANDAALNIRRERGPRLDKEYEILLDALGFEPASVDLLIERSGLKADAVASMLLILELEGRIESYPGGLYVQRAS